MRSYPKDYCMDLVVLDDRKGRTKTPLRLQQQTPNELTDNKSSKKKLLMKEVERIHAFKKSP